MVGWDPKQRCPSSSRWVSVQVNVLERLRNNSERRSKVSVTKTLAKAHFQTAKPYLWLSVRTLAKVSGMDC